MVYESDFYTTRRPYTRPYVSSYNITPLRGAFYLYDPYYSSTFDFDDEARDIRARTDNLLRRIHVFVPRPCLSEYDETSPERLRSDDYVRRIINAKNARKEIESLPWYSSPEKRDIGSGHLACIKYAGGRPVARRRPYYTVSDLRPSDVKSDVNLMSFYVKNRKAAEDALKKQPDEETIQRIQQYIEKKAAEKRMEEEKRAWEIAERKRIAEEKEIARLAALKLEEDRRLAEIAEQERLEAEKQAIEKRAEEARREAERLIEDEKLFKEAVAQAIADEQERIAKEMEEELKQKKIEEEEKLANVDLADTNGLSVEPIFDERHSEEHSIHAELSDQDNEAKPYEVDNDEDTQIEEEEREEEDDIENPFVDGGAASLPDAQDVEPVVETPRIKESRNAGGEQGFDWSQFENEPEIEEEAQAPQVEEETTATEDNQHVFEEADVVEAQAEEVQVTEEAQTEETQEEEAQPEEAQVEEAQVEETQVEEAQVEETQVEETQVTEEERQEEEANAMEEAQVKEEEDEEIAQATEEAQVEESQSQEKSTHDASEEEDEEEEEE